MLEEVKFGARCCYQESEPHYMHKYLRIAKQNKSMQGYSPVETQQALSTLENLRDLIISYAGLTMQEPDMFPQPSG